MTTLFRANATIGTDVILSALESDGAVIIEDLFDGSALNDELGGYFDAAHKSEGHFYGHSTRRFSALMAKSKMIERLCTDPLLLAVANGTMRDNCERIQLNLTQAIDILPGETSQFLHRDDELFPFENDFVAMINVMLAVTDFTVENGATRLVRGSHLWDREREPQPSDIEYATMKAGSALIYLGNVLHAGSKNNSTASRRGAIISYNLGMLKQTENFMLSVPWDKAKHFSDDLLKLMGYQIHRPNLGWVEGIDPLEWIRAGRPELVKAKDALTSEQEELLSVVMSDPEQFSAYL